MLSNEPGDITLREENTKLKKELERVEGILLLQKKGAYVISAAGASILLGPALVVAIKNYLDASEKHIVVPNTIKAELFGAIIKRILYVGAFGAFIALLPVVMLFWQNIEIREQTEILSNQIVLQQQAELHRTVFGETRQKQEAVKVLLAQLRKDSSLKSIDLVGIYLNEIVFPHADFSHADLRKSILAHSIFEQSMFDNGILDGATATFTNFEGSSFRNASLKKSELTEATFINADLTNANFQGAHIQGANFSHAILKGTNFTDACYIKDKEQPKTIWPEGFNPEAHGINTNCVFNDNR